MQQGLSWLATIDSSLQWSEANGVVDIKQAPADLQSRTKQLPREAIPEDYRFLLTDNKDRIMEDMKLARDDESGTFGKLQYLWPQHPVNDWLRQRITDSFGRHTAPVIRLPDQLEEDQHWYLAHGGFPNRRGQALIQDHAAVQITDGAVTDLLPLADCLQQLGINHNPLPNRAEARDCTALAAHLPAVVEHLRNYLQGLRTQQNTELQQQVKNELATLSALREKHLQQIDIDFSNNEQVASIRDKRRAERQQQIERHFKDYETWLRDSATTEAEPYIQIVAVITGSIGDML
jgi:hypothetical protein